MRAVSDHEIEQALYRFSEFLSLKRLQKGQFPYCSRAELWGKIREEFMEFEDAIKVRHRESTIDELLDVMVACLWGIVTIEHWATLGPINPREWRPVDE